jgi:hypothetical protein
MADRDYRDTHAKNRGAFLEKSASDMLKTVFGGENVFDPHSPSSG